ncbi:hypothetical protein DOM22_18060 [Bdellovibrio sp. ZAP7]|uniref:hypothetical protein n=1 Tax=Bdellovibrio sp. ZAP7 TaxID=2231053 RepID=UPI001156D136|nr:hypothetical protein [Bdellovibrio sp. ZAP7]QDK46925.1 hypothetical protein DOM22_18060 [Bdellovibrio sp. ZAP7]
MNKYFISAISLLLAAQANAGIFTKKYSFCEVTISGDSPVILGTNVSSTRLPEYGEDILGYLGVDAANIALDALIAKGICPRHSVKLPVDKSTVVCEQYKIKESPETDIAPFTYREFKTKYIMCEVGYSDQFQYKYVFGYKAGQWADTLTESSNSFGANVALNVLIAKGICPAYSVKAITNGKHPVCN